MLCSHCGKLIDDDRLLCDACERVADGEHDNREDSAPVSVSRSCKTISISPMAVKVICILAAVAMIAALLIIFWQPLMRLLGYPLGFDTPSEHFAYVEGKALDKLNDRITSVYGSAHAFTEKNTFAAETEVHLRLGREVLNLLGNYLSENNQLDVSWLQDIMLKMDVSGDSERGRSVFTLGLNDIPVLNAEMIVDMKEGALWTGFPELAEGYLKSDLEQTTEAVYNVKTFRDYLKAFPVEQDVNKLINKYMQLVFSEITNVKSEDGSVSVGEISQNCTVLTATIDEATVNRILISLLSEARDDEKLCEIIKNIIFFDSDEGLSDFDTQWKKDIDDAIAQARNALEASVAENNIILTDYVDDKHNIIGRRITVSRDENIYYLIVKDGKDFAFESNIMDVFTFYGSGDIASVLNAQCVFETEGRKIASIAVTDLDTVKLSRGLLDGIIRITPSDALNIYEGIHTDTVLELVLNAGSIQEDISLNLLSQDKLLLGLTVKGNEKDYKPVSIPRDVLDASDEEALIQWMSGFQYDKIIKKLKKAGVSQNWLDMFALMIGE